jgi:hypothetical protein
MDGRSVLLRESGYRLEMSRTRLDPAWIAGYRERCLRILSGAERPYDVVGELMWHITENPAWEALPGTVYIMWAELHDAYEPPSAVGREYAEQLMRAAASEFLALGDYESELADHADGWIEKIALDQKLNG